MTSGEGTGGRLCPVCERVIRREFRPGPGGRPHAKCPRCGSLERHRFFAVLLGVLAARTGPIDVLLDIAPTPHTTEQLRVLAPRHHVRTDISSARGVDIRSSLTGLPFADESVDLLVAYHVLEHIPDDRAAMREIARVLSRDGIGLLQVPWKPGQPTEEDPDASPEERKRRFGLADHVRQYGADFEDRLVESGLSVRRVSATDLLGAEMTAWMHVSEREVVWVVRPATGDRARLDVLGRTPLAGTLDALVGELSTVRRQRDQARARVRRLRAAAARAQRSSLSRRLAGRVRRAVRR